MHCKQAGPHTIMKHQKACQIGVQLVINLTRAIIPDALCDEQAGFFVTSSRHTSKVGSKPLRMMLADERPFLLPPLIGEPVRACLVASKYTRPMRNHPLSCK